ncbi:MAG: sialate O-acetylesterase [Bacteroidota bacterium]|nr:sialate O-acetylesterase [Bacteroidota bacterium]
MKLHGFNRSTLCKVLPVLALFLASSSLFARVTLPALFTDNMVLQQQSDAPIWGKAAPGKNVSVVTSWDHKTYLTRAAADGTWKLKVNTPPASLNPYDLTISDGKSITLHNVLIGEVWICSGQSNMEMPLADWGKIADYEKEIAAADFPNIRLLQVEKSTSLSPQSDLKVSGGSWKVCSPAAIPLFSATAYFFGRNLYQNLNIPIGLIHTSWGGTLVEAWTSEQSLEVMPDFADYIRELKKMPAEDTQRTNFMNQKLVDWKNELIAKDRGFKGNEAIWAKMDVNDAEWKSMLVPQFWDEQGFSDFDGVIWFRKTLNIPAEWQGHDITLNLGMVDDNDLTFFNGQQIGSTEGWDRSRTYIIPGKFVKQGKAVITVRVFDSGGGGGFHGDKDAVNIYLSADKKINLSGNWQYAIGFNLKDIPQPILTQNTQNNPASLYNAMIHPLIPFAFKGVIWYQGEANVDRAYQYRELFPLLIHDWRKQWNSAFPFYFVQLANFLPQKTNPEPSAWAELREAQANAMHLDNTGMAVIIDLGEGGNIHPKNKQEVGRRLALLARNKTYGQNVVGSGPVYESYVVENGKIRIKFKNTGSGLTAKNNETLKGFAIAGPDHTFYWADAMIDGNEIIVSSPKVEFPVAVRYAWADNPECNLINKANLPASPFRTDDWPGMTFQKK